MTMHAQERTIATDLLPPRLAALGYIKLGRKSAKTTGSGSQLPERLDHFLVTTRTRGPDGNFVLDEAVHRVVGPKPTALDVRLPFDSRGENFYAQMQHYAGRTCERHCDGVTCTMAQTEVQEPCPRRSGRPCPCKPYGRLAVILEAAPTFGGLYVFRTTSWESVNSIQTALKMFQEQFGSLRGLPLTMQAYPAEVRYKQGGQEKTSTAYKAALVLRASFEQAQRDAIEFHRSAQIARREILALSAGTAAALDELDREETAEIGDEFWPQTSTSAAPKPASKLAQLNREFLQEARAGDPPPEEVLASDERHVDALIDELRGLQARADALKIGLRKQEAKLNAAVESRDPKTLQQSIDWLAGQIAAKEQRPAAPDQPSLLES